MTPDRISSDVIRVEDKFYVLASSALADDRTRVLKYGDTFGVFNRYGDIETVGRGELGLFHVEARHLSRMVLQVNQRTPLLLGSTVRSDNALLSIDLTNLDDVVSGVRLPQGTLHIYRSKFLDEGTCYEELRLTNHGLAPIALSLQFEFEADFADIFEVRGTARAKRGVRRPGHVNSGSVTLSYQGLDGFLRTTCLQFSPGPKTLTSGSAVYDVQLNPREESVISVTAICERNGGSKSAKGFSIAFAERSDADTQVPFEGCRVTTSSTRFNEWLTRSEADLRMMIQGNPEGAYPYAGVPWFATVFGRDGIITAMECLWIAPWIAQGVLRYLAKTQATEVAPEQDAEPGKIVHEIRRGEMAVVKEVPFARYYGSVDSTPLFVLLAGGYFLRTNDVSFLRTIWPNITKALDWIDGYGDPDGDGFVEYSRQSTHGLTQQGWKDSGDSIFHADGNLAEPPIALCEVQAYVYAAKRSAAIIAKALGFEDRGRQLDRQASDLQHRFEAAFWNDDLKIYALALDGQKQPCSVRTSNAGHALFCGIASHEHAAIAAETLMSRELFSGWGVRTVASGEARYNPMSYHNGSVWPHDTAIVAFGLSLYGFHAKVAELLFGLYEASLHMDLHRMPELFCGFHKRNDTGGPTLYPVACAPQAWAAGSVYLLLSAVLGITIRAFEPEIRFANPALPPNLDVVTIENLRVGNAVVDLLIRRHADGVAIEVPRKEGDIEVITSL